MARYAIRAKNVSKKYKLRRESNYLTLREEIFNSIKRPLYLLKHKVHGHTFAEDDFWALKDVSFDVKQGEVVGIIGRNGAGKTTLLKILSKITYPEEGEIRLCGRVSSLLEVGAGFHAELTGRENIFFNGAILGMKKTEIKKKFNEIVAFAEIEKFLDIPAKRYSSGMYVRLAFAVAAHLESEILLVDEILSVGDVVFQRKCLGKMDNLANEGRTVLFVTHNMAAASNLCSTGILLDEGRMAYRGSMDDVIKYYLEKKAVYQSEICLPPGRQLHDGQFRFLAARVYGLNHKVASQVSLSHGFEVEIEYEVLRQMKGLDIEFTLWNSKGECVFVSTDIDTVSLFSDVVREPGHYISHCRVPGSYLRPDRYKIDISANITGLKKLNNLPGALFIEVIDDRKMQNKITSTRKGIITPVLEWRTEKVGWV